MISFNEEWNPSNSLEDKLAKKIAEILLASNTLSASSETEPNISTLHIAEYLDEMFYEQGYTAMNITITKDPELGNLHFSILHKEK